MDVDLEEVTIEWEGFSTALSGDLWQYYMAKELSDVTISTEDGRDIRSHRIVLALCSAFFRDLFKRNNAPNQIGKPNCCCKLMFFFFLLSDAKEVMSTIAIEWQHYLNRFNFLLV